MRANTQGEQGGDGAAPSSATAGCAGMYFALSIEYDLTRRLEALSGAQGNLHVRLSQLSLTADVFAVPPNRLAVSALFVAHRLGARYFS